MKVKWRGEKKVRGKKKKHRLMVKVSDVTSEGFRLRTFNKEYYISREWYPFFKYATTHEIQRVRIFRCACDDPADNWVNPADHPDLNFADSEPYPDHGDILYWPLLDVDLGTNDLEYKWRADDIYASRELFERMARERYLKKYWKGLPNKQHKNETSY